MFTFEKPGLVKPSEMHYENNHHIERIICTKQSTLCECMHKAMVLCLHVSKKKLFPQLNSALLSGCSYNLEMACSFWKFLTCRVCHFLLLCLHGKAIWEAKEGLGKIVQVSKYHREECRWRWWGKVECMCIYTKQKRRPGNGLWSVELKHSTLA